MGFIVATEDYAGLGFAVRLVEEGHRVLIAANPNSAEVAKPDVCARYTRVGDGMVEKLPLHGALARRETFRDAYWIWDLNHSVAENELLRSEGFRILGGGQHA